MNFSMNSDTNKEIPWSRIHPSMIRFVFCSLLAFFAMLSCPNQAPSAAAAPDTTPEPPQTKVLVQQGINAFEKKELEDALQSFESAAIIYPDNYVIPYYLGMIYLKKGERLEAIAQWKKYVALRPEAESTEKIRKYITLLLLEEARAYAQNAIAKKAQGKIGPTDDNSVAVTTFKNLGSKKLDPLGKGMAAMIIADLTAFKNIKVVEREKLQALLVELKLGTSGLVDEKSAPKVGKLLRAKFVASGSLTDLEKENLQIASILFDADKNFPSGFQDVQGRISQFYDLEKKIACRIITDLGHDCAKAPKAFSKIHTKSLLALIAYSQGLNLLDRKKFDQARAKFEEALREDPEFDLAREALAATPSDAMLRLSESQMVANASATVPATAAVPIVAPAPSDPAGGTAANGIFGTGIGTTAAITGGTVLLGGGIAAIALSGGDSGSGGGGDDSSDDLTGVWRGDWNSSNGENGDMTLTIDTQSGNNLAGSIEFTGSGCISSGPVQGQQNSDQVQLTISSQTAGASLTATISNQDDHDRLSGTMAVDSGECSGVQFDINLEKTGSANVGW